MKANKSNTNSNSNSYHGKISNSPAMFVPAVFSSVKTKNVTGKKATKPSK